MLVPKNCKMDLFCFPRFEGRRSGQKNQLLSIGGSRPQQMIIFRSQQLTLHLPSRCHLSMVDNWIYGLVLDDGNIRDELCLWYSICVLLFFRDHDYICIRLSTTQQKRLCMSKKKPIQWLAISWQTVHKITSFIQFFQKIQRHQCRQANTQSNLW
jgi:hypothetical protein